MITWINFLHLYQPPTQSKEVLDQVTQESYALLPELMRRYPRMRFTINFSGSLLELLETHGYHALLEEYRELAADGRIELVGSAMYHPILALFPEDEIRRQIIMHTEMNRKIFGDAYRPKGFYIPEMTYSKKVADVVHALGFEWLILDEFHFPKGKPRSDTRYVIKDNGLRVLFRNRSFSKTFPPEFILTHRHEIEDQAIIIAHDGELYGHWHKDDKGYYEKAFTDSGITMPTVSEYLDTLKKEKEVTPRESSWESLEEELAANNPFILWNASDNAIHQALWRFARFVIKTVNAHRIDINYALARRHADRGMASCAWWWATRAQLVATSPVCWSPSEIEKGARELVVAVRTIDHLPLATRLKAEASYARLTKRIWETHWKIHAGS
ncbi:MAG: hypothetical protein PHT88_03780 [Candidatus Moranbacteria bacterium]|nr:hypothetical protein [Candidatus Moranbacteria bacterium]